MNAKIKQTSQYSEELAMFQNNYSFRTQRNPVLTGKCSTHFELQDSLQCDVRTSCCICCFQFKNKTKQKKSLLLQKQYAICPDFCAFKYSDIWKVECLLWHTYPLKNFCSHVCDLSFFKSFVWHLQTVSYEMNRKQTLHIVLIKDRQTCCLFCKK